MNNVDRLVRIMIAVAEQGTCSASDICAACKVPPATAYRTLSRLREVGVVAHRSGLWSPGPVMIRMASMVMHNAKLCDLATVQAALNELAARSGETASFTIRVGAHAIRLLAAEVPGGFHVVQGEVAPLHLGASRKVILSHLPDEEIEACLKSLGERHEIDRNALLAEIDKIRKAGYSVTRGERTPGSVSLAAPVLDAEGRVMASVSLSVPASRIDAQRELVLLGFVRQTAESLYGSTSAGLSFGWGGCNG